MSSPDRPVLWHLAVSHYSEKARWALAHKGIEHTRKAPPPGAHMLVAMALTRSRHHTFPLLQLRGRTIGGSAQIIAALEDWRPDPPLYPEDPAARSRALELERWFDAEVGPPVRLLAWHELRADTERMRDFSVQLMPGPLKRLPGAEAIAGEVASTFVQLRFRVADPADAQRARAQTVAAFDRLEAELESQPGDYLAGDRFSVADLAAASLLYPLVAPPEGPSSLPEPPQRLAEFRQSIAGRPGFAWVAEMYRRHRRQRPDT